ncbi:MAG TPA: glycosyltransferase family 2 protein [Candidatus Choladousia intestinavium]|uniref:Glycosyltransferase family 2 protein n=1 Tax=Candidatus Choladousia intestinavium TaxID=2840727 RepID=A0A9D1D7V4_9FIRM|nr:glycosyltransferase family 2 protein [Candidatus Choladousia intestinavium]
MKPSIDVIIPVYKPDGGLRQLLKGLMEQTLLPEHILLVNTEESYFDPSVLEGIRNVQVIHIKKREFDHGGTRHMAAEMLQGEFLLFMTQDAQPADRFLLEKLYRPFSQKRICASYARQKPKPGCGELERYTRSFNYGSQDRIQTKEDLPSLGIKTFFCSNVCAMYRRRDYEAMDGFPRPAIFNEDMIFAGKAIMKGKAVAYCAEAVVLHSHNYTGIQQFKRNFDLGVSQADHPEIFQAARSESEGIRLVKQTAGYLIKRRKPWLLPKLVFQSGCKYLGYRLGKGYEKLPLWVIRRCTASASYWENAGERKEN